MENTNKTPKPSATGTQAVINTVEEGGLKNNVIPTIPTVPSAQTITELPESKPASSKRKVEIDADVLESILSDLAQVKENQAQLEQTSSQDQIRKIEALRATGKLVKSVRIHKVDNKFVVGWKTLLDDVWIENGKHMERQSREITFDGGETKVMSLTEYTRECTKESYEVIAESKTQNGVMFTVVVDGGREIVINSLYVN